MSSVTSLILSFDDLPGLSHGETLLVINKYFVMHGNGVEGLVAINDPKLPKHWYGGHHALQADIAIGAYNYNVFDLADFIAHLRSLPWRDSGNDIQLMYMRENDKSFTTLTIFEAD